MFDTLIPNPNTPDYMNAPPHTDISNIAVGSYIYTGKRTVFDSMISCRINSNFTVFFEFLNLNEEPQMEYTGVSDELP